MNEQMDRARAGTQQDFIERLPIGECYSIAQRFDLTYGISDRARAEMGDKLRNRMDQAIFKARTRMAGKRFTTEVVNVLAQRGNTLFIIAVVTRTE